jgi:hypothetical protein
MLVVKDFVEGLVNEKSAALSVKAFRNPPETGLPQKPLFP